MTPGLQHPVPRSVVTAEDGLLLVDKPAGMSSHDVVARVRRMAATKRVGHGGTLDPMATGLLVLGIGRGTKLLTYLLGHDKAYKATVRLGISTTTDDADGEVITREGCSEISPAHLEAALEPLRGEIMQRPASVSAIKVDGKRAYARVRAGEQVQLQARPITISKLQVTNPPHSAKCGDLDVVDFDIEVVCSAGTYVRSIARDLGEALGCGAHLTALRRTCSGPFKLASAASLPGMVRLIEGCSKDANPLPVLGLTESCRELFKTVVSERASDLRFGKRIPPVGVGRFAVENTDGTVVAVVESDERASRPILVLDPA